MRTTFTLGIVCLFFAIACFGQLDLASLDGTVTDGSGGAISGAKVSVKDFERNAVMALTTND